MSKQQKPGNSGSTKTGLGSVPKMQNPPPPPQTKTNSKTK